MNFRVEISKRDADTKVGAHVVEATVECEYGVLLQAFAMFMNRVGGSHEAERDWNSIVNLVDERVQSAFKQPDGTVNPKLELHSDPKSELYSQYGGSYNAKPEE